MLSRRKISDWIGAVYYHPITTLLINFIVGIALTIVAERFITSDSVRKAFSYIITALVTLATLQTFWFRYEFARYFKRDYIQEIVSLGGKTTRELQVYIFDQDEKGVATLYPGKEYTVEFNIKGGLLAKNPLLGKLTPTLRMSPPLFLGDPSLQKVEKEVSIWIGPVKPISSFDHSNSWNVRGIIPFDTSRINPAIKLAEEVQLALEFREDDNVVFMFELGKFAVHLMKEQELLSTLIGFGALKKLPPGYDVLKITRDYYTNIVFLPRVLIELKKSVDTEDKVDEIEVAIASIIKDKYLELQQRDSRKKLGLLAYNSEPSEQDLNLPEFIDNIMSATNLVKPAPSKLEQHVYVSIFQTSEFLSRLEKEHALGICMFGFKQCIPNGPNLTVIFDLSKLAIAPSISADECVIDKSDLYELANSSPEHFQKHAPVLGKELIQSGSKAISSEEREMDLSSELPSSLDSLLIKLENPFYMSRKWGRFIVSEPEITKIWINLAVFSRELNESHLNKELIQAIFLLIDRAMEGYSINRSNLSIVNLCSKQSGIANELSVLWNLDQISKATFNIPCCNVAIDSKSGEVTLQPKDEVTDAGQIRDVILLVPIDSYVKAIKRVLEHVRERRNNVISVISLFSLARNWDFVTAAEYFDVHPLFQVDPDPKDPLLPHSQRITQRDDIRRLRKWLGQ